MIHLTKGSTVEEEERRKLARAIVQEFFKQIDLSLGAGLRKKLFYIFVMLLFIGGIFFGIIKIPGVTQ